MSSLPPVTLADAAPPADAAGARIVPAGHVTGISVRPAKGAEVTPVSATRVTVAAGLEGDHMRRAGRRGVTVIRAEDWQAACRALGIDLPWYKRRANILLAGAPPLEGRQGQRLQLGEVILEITGECDPCEVMEALHPGLRQALSPAWRGGVTTRVLRAGDLSHGAVATLLE